MAIYFFLISVYFHNEDLLWLTEGRKFIGEKKIKGNQHNSLILQWCKDIKRGAIKDDEVICR